MNPPRLFVLIFGSFLCTASLCAAVSHASVEETTLIVPDPAHQSNTVTLDRVFVPTTSQTTALAQSVRLIGMIAGNNVIAGYSNSELDALARYLLSASMVQRADNERIVLYSPVVQLFIFIWLDNDVVRAGLLTRSDYADVKGEDDRRWRYVIPAVYMLHVSLNLLRYSGPSGARPEWDFFLSQASKREAERVVKNLIDGSMNVQYAENHPCRQVLTEQLFNEAALTQAASSYPHGLASKLRLVMAEPLDSEPSSFVGRWRFTYADNVTFRHFLEVTLAYDVPTGCRYISSTQTFAY